MLMQQHMVGKLLKLMLQLVNLRCIIGIIMVPIIGVIHHVMIFLHHEMEISLQLDMVLL